MAARGRMSSRLQMRGTVLAKQRWPVKVSSTEQNLLDQRARDEVNNRLPGYVYETFVCYSGVSRENISVLLAQHIFLYLTHAVAR